MKKTYFIIAAMMLVFATPQKAEAASPSDIIGYVLGKIKGKMSKTEIQKLLCQKASFPTKYSLRSAGGLACKETKIALFAKLVCKGYKDFEGSGCDKNASKIYKDTSNVFSVLKDAIKRDLSITGKAFCTVGGIIPAVGDVIGGACDAVGLGFGGGDGDDD